MFLTSFHAYMQNIQENTHYLYFTQYKKKKNLVVQCLLEKTLYISSSRRIPDLKS